ncbi:MAG: CmcJ/NvfI family oxidoreductase [Alphaproteobacteria bacterium]
MPDSSNLTLPYVDTWMNYAGDIKGRARVDGQDWRRTNLVLDKRDVRICDARPIKDELSLDREGFILTTSKTSVDYSIDDMSKIAPAYLAEVGAQLKALTGADLVVAQNTGLLKRYAERARVKGVAGPSRWAHMDYTHYSAGKWIEWIEGWQNLKLRHYSRYVVLQTWRCVSPPPQDNAFVLCDASTIDGKDLIVFDAVMREPIGEPGNAWESQLCKYNPAMRWYYFPNMTADELIVFKAHDTDKSWNAQPLHNSADIPGLPPDALPRASIEARFFAFWN